MKQLNLIGRAFPRVALIHYWLVGMRGGEKVLEALCRMFPNADIYTHALDRGSLSPTLARHKIHLTSVGRLPFANRLYPAYLPLMPRALEELDLSGYDLVISSEAGPAKGVIVPPGVPHLCYCHSPMRYLWDQYHVYKDAAGPLSRAALPLVAHRLRQWDVTSAQRIDRIIANSTFVARRIKRYWNRTADVVAPPVAIDAFQSFSLSDVGGFYLMAGELASYKRPDLAIAAFRELDKPLVVIGGPPAQAKALQRIAGPKTRFLGKVPFDVLRHYMARCRALVFPGEEDFGIVPVEVMASGRPVIAYGRGGVTDTVIDQETGLFFQEQTVQSLTNAIHAFEASDLGSLSADMCRNRAQDFSEAAFVRGIQNALDAIGEAQLPHAYSSASVLQKYR